MARFAPFCLVAFLTLAAPASGVPIFLPLGFPPGSVETHARTISADGATVVGHSISGGASEGFVWTAEGGFTSLGIDARPTAVSGDGSVVVGFTSVDGKATSFRWTASSGMELLQLPGVALDVSADGSVIVGRGANGFRWTEAGGAVLLDGGANAVSADGSTLVGFIGTQFAHSSAVLCDASGTRLTLVPGGLQTAAEAVDVSADGSVVVGFVNNDLFRWTEAGGAVPLLSFPFGEIFGQIPSVHAVSGDGSIVVGSAYPNGPAWIWDLVHGVRPLHEVLADEYGLDVSGWTLSSADGISADGRTIAGWGVDPDGREQAWLVFLPEPGLGWMSLLALGAVASRRRL